jgi:hypothetical protein
MFQWPWESAQGVKEDVVDHFRNDVKYPLYELDLDIAEELDEVP